MSEEIIDQAAEGQGQRPTFLTVLCILTWIGSGLGLLGLLAEGSSYNPGWYNIVIALLNVGTAYAAWEMWSLKKSGLMIYTVCEVAAIILPFILIYAILPSQIAGLIGSMAILMAVFPIAFLIMYWLNAKHLK